MIIRTLAGTLTAGALAASLAAGVLVASLVASPAAAEPHTSDLTFTNANDNPGSFDCYAYKSGAWKKLNDGDSTTIKRSTPIKCDAAWYLTDFYGQLGGKAKANQAYTVGTNLDPKLDWVLAVKA